MKKLITLFLLTFGIANAQTHTFKFILPTTPGSGTDVSIETYAPCLKKQNISILKEYKPGAEGLVALKALQSARDTDLITNLLIGNFGLNTLSKFPGVDLLEDINPIVYMNSTPLVFVAKAGKYKSLDELVTENKGRILNIGSPSVTGIFLTDIIFKEMNAQFQVVPYKSSVQGLTDVVNGNLDMFVDTFIGARPLVEANRIQIMTSTFDKEYATKFNHSNIGTYSTKLAKLPIGLGLIVSVQPSLDKETRNMLIKAMHTCGKDIDVIRKLEANSSHPVFLSTNDIVNMVKQFSGK
jgi:tripartite-type tricarboxylate transporter receptor subunit TctC